MTTSCSEPKPKKDYTKLQHLVPGVVQMRSEGLTLQEIGDKLNLSRQRIHQVIASAKEMEETLRLWGFPFSNRTFRVLEDLCIHSKEEALALYKSGHLYPGAIWSFGWKSYREICEWLEVEPLNRRPRRNICCIHCGKPT